MVKFALAGMKNSLFVSHYQWQLPTQEEVEAFIQQAMAKLESKADGKGHSILCYVDNKTFNLMCGFLE